MRLKLLLVTLLVSSGMLIAQDTIRTLIISEARYDRADMAYLELTNVGSEAINLAEFEVSSMDPWTTFPDDRRWPTEPPHIDGRHVMLPDRVLEPGESFVISAFHDWVEEEYARDIAKLGWSEKEAHRTKPELKKLTDLPVHRPESPTGDPTDSVSTFRSLLESWGGRDAIFVRHYPPGADSCVIDQVGGLFTDENGSNPDGGRHDVAGVAQATNECILVRRYVVEEGNLTFVRGNDLSESEWIPIPILREGGDKYEPWRAVFWTVGNHGDFNLDETTLTSSTIDIDWTNHVLTVPWGVRNDDSIMYQFDRVPGLAWHYQYNTGETASADSAYASVRTGDSLTIYACGNDMDMIKWHIEAAPPTVDANWVIPMRIRSTNPPYEYGLNTEVYEVSHMMKEGILDTISEIPFATRTDSLLKYLEKAPNASWEFVWVDGNVRTDLKDGDLLRVTAEDGSVKDYYLKVWEYRNDDNAYLSAITWPDIPEDYRDFYDWTGDTIPFFDRGVFSYKVMVPLDVEGIPALVAKNEDDNASHQVTRATNLFGSKEDRTVTFTSTAEDDSTVYKYSVLLDKEKDPANVQPWAGEPFISQYTWKTEFNHSLLEIVNPGNQVLDLSDYMFFNAYENDPVNAIAGWDDWAQRYIKYIPGYKWQSEAEWGVQRHIAVQDINTNTFIQPGDVFVMSEVNLDQAGFENYVFYNQIDIDFRHLPWGEAYTGNTIPFSSWNGANLYMWKILNDSIKLGLKPATDPDDFLLIETWGMGDGSAFAPVGDPSGQVSSYTRKPEVYQGNPEFQGSFGATPEESEWILVNENTLQTRGYPWPQWRTLVPEGTGSHFMNDVTIYRSTVGSLVYKVSLGYSMEEDIRGVITGTTVEELFGNLILADPGQALQVLSSVDGTAIDSAAAVVNGDTLMVTSADSTNVSKYILEVTDDGLSDDAVLTSATYTITVDGETGTVGGYDYGVSVKSVLEGVDVPAGATLTVVDENDAYVPLQRVNFDTTYVDVMVNDHIFFEVMAEDGKTKILYQLTPNASESDAFVTSDVYLVDQEAVLISLVPQGISVESFLGNLVPAPGATWQLYDKLGYERDEGIVAMDDRLVVTAADGVTTNTYYLILLNELANYLAYVVSDVYVVSQEELTISGVRASHSVADFMNNVEPAEGATLEVQTSTGTTKTDSDMMAEEDILIVTAGNGVNTVIYVITLDYTGVEDYTGAGISIYPNPTREALYIAGAEVGSRIRVYNAVGMVICDVAVHNNIEKISLDDQSRGLFFVTVSQNNVVIGRYKVVKN